MVDGKEKQTSYPTKWSDQIKQFRIQSLHVKFRHEENRKTREKLSQEEQNVPE